MTVQELIDVLTALSPEQKEMMVIYGCDDEMGGSPIEVVYEGRAFGVHPVIRLNTHGERREE